MRFHPILAELLLQELFLDSHFPKRKSRNPSKCGVRTSSLPNWWKNSTAKGKRCEILSGTEKVWQTRDTIGFHHEKGMCVYVCVDRYRKVCQFNPSTALLKCLWFFSTAAEGQGKCALKMCFSFSFFPHQLLIGSSSFSWGC